MGNKGRNVALIGCGYWGKNLARNLYELGALKTICDLSPKSLEPFRSKYDVEFATDYSKVFSDPDIKGVVIATPAETHFALGTSALEAGKDLYVEKPLALEIDHAKKLIAMAKNKGAILMVGHILHYHPAVRKMKELITSGEIGRVQSIYSNRMSLGKIRREENILWSFAPHDVSLVQSILKENPSSVYSSGGCFLHEKLADTTISVFEYESGARAHIYVSWLHPFKEQRFVVIGSKKMLVFNDVEKKDKLLLYPHEIEWNGTEPTPHKKDAISVPFDEGEPLKNEIKAFLESIETRKTPLTDGSEGLNTLRILSACQASLEEKRVIQFNGTPKTDGEGYFAHSTAVIDEPCEIGKGTKIWHFTHVLKGSRIGENCNLGQNVVIGPDVSIGNRCKIQNNISVYKGVTLEDDVFCGPSMVFTNVINPRSHIKRMDELKPTIVRKGATIGANATIICGVTIGKYSFIGAGAVVLEDVPDYAMVVGNPGVIKGWMCECGERLTVDDGIGVCNVCNKKLEINDTLVAVAR